MILYHGSDKIIKSPAFGVGNPKNDYGLGFYCTEHLDLAKEWACSEGRDGFANMYTLNLEDLKVLDLQSDDYHILNWLAILLQNRTFVLKNGLPAEAHNYILENFLPSYRDYDVIRGYRADDSYFAFTQDFINNTISLRQLRKAMYLGKLGEQIVIKSKRAFSYLKFEKPIVAANEVYYPNKVARDRSARNAFRIEKTLTPVIDDVYVIDIIRNGWKNDDTRLR